MQRAIRLSVFIVFGCVVPAVAGAQVTTGVISGTIRDSSDAVLPGAEIFILNTGTGISRTVKADGEGRYEAPNLAIGEYELTVTAPGFKTEIRSGITLTIGLTAVLNFVLSPGALTEQVTVVQQAPLVETASSSVGTLVTREQIRDMPLNGRDYTQLALIQPGVVQYREQSRELNRGMGVRFSIAGARHNQVGFRLNGVDVADAAGTTPGSATGHNLGVDAIQEFQVLTNTFTAEHGKAAGGVVNIVHKSGTNELHGSAFEYLRHSSMDARNFFDPADPPPFRRNQFGFSVGGPVFRNRTFFFGAYEGLREQLALTGTNIVLSDAAKNGAFGPVNPIIRPWLDAMPTANGQVFSNGTAEAINEVRTESDENYVVIKLDHTFSASDSLSGSYTFDDGRVDAPNPRAGMLTYSTVSKNRFNYLTLNHTHIFSPNVLLSTRGGYNHSHVDALRVPLVDLPTSLGFVPGVMFSTIEATGLDNFGISMGEVIDRKMRLETVQAGTTLTWIRGSHSFKTGMEAYRIKSGHTSFGRPSGGRYVFDSIPNLLAARPQLFQAEDPTAPRNPTINQGLYGFFIQDDIRMRDNLTVNAGVRYEFISTPRSTEANQSTLVNLTDPVLQTGRDVIKNPSLKNFAPRVGAAWDVFGNQRTAVRGGIGVYHDQITSYYYMQVIEGNPPFGLSRSVQGAPFPNGWAVIGGGSLPALLDLTMLDFNLEQPWRLQYNVGLQQEVSRNMAVAVYFVGARAYNSSQFFLNANGRAPAGTTADGRLLFRATDPRANPNFGVMQYRRTNGDSWYKSAQFVLQRRPVNGLSFQASYTLGQSEDTGSIISVSSEGLNTVSQQSIYAAGDEEKGLSSFDVRHVVSINANYDLPWGDNWGGVASALAAGWQLSGIVNLSSGHPFTPILAFDNANVLTRSRGDHLRPDLAPGGDSNPTDPGNVAQYFDPTQFVLPPAGTLGTLTRNTIIGPGVATVDASAKKRFRIGGSRLIEFRAEVFNLLNRANFRIPEDTQRQILNRGGVINPTAGRITATTTPSRQMQLSLRFEF